MCFILHNVSCIDVIRNYYICLKTHVKLRLILSCASEGFPQVPPFSPALILSPWL